MNVILVVVLILCTLVPTYRVHLTIREHNTYCLLKYRVQLEYSSTVIVYFILEYSVQANLVKYNQICSKYKAQIKCTQANSTSTVNTKYNYKYLLSN